MKLGKMLSVGEVVEQPGTEETPAPELPTVAERPGPVAAEAPRVDRESAPVAASVDR